MREFYVCIDKPSDEGSDSLGKVKILAMDWDAAWDIADAMFDNTGLVTWVDEVES